MAALTRDDVIRMVCNVETAHDRIAAFAAPYENIPSPGSLADAELGTFSQRESVRTAHAQGIVLVEVAADQLIAFSKTVTEPVQTFAPWTCVRSLLEASALAYWLFDPGVEVRVRVQRSMAFRYEGLCQELKFHRASDQQADAAKVQRRLEDMEGIASQLDFTAGEIKKKTLPGVGMAMPSATEIIRDELKEEAMYRLLSAVAHGHHWALSQLGLQKVDEDTAVPDRPEGARGHRLEKALQPSSVAVLCTTAVVNFGMAVWRQAVLFGWDSQKLGDLFEAISDDLEIQADRRFWRAG